MDILVSGDDEVALTVTEALMERHQVVLLAPESWRVARLDRLDAEVVRGRATSTEALKRAGADHCHVFIACSDNDEANIVACLGAKAIGVPRSICMLGNPGFLEADHDDVHAESVGVDVIVRPWEQLAEEILRIVTVPGALEVELLASQRIEILAHAVEDRAPITRFPIKQYPLPPDVVLLSVRRGGDTEIVRGDTQLRVGDKLTVMGKPAAVDVLLYGHLRSPEHKRDRRSATIVGGGVVGFLVAEGLAGQGWETRLLEIDRARAKEIAPLLPRTLVLHGDGSDLEVLQEEQVDQAPVLIAVTDNDEKNLLVSMMARTLGVRRVITRASRLSNEKLFEELGVDVVRSARGAAVRTIVHNTVDVRTEVRAELEHGDIHVYELELPARYAPIALRDIHTNLFSIVGAVVRGRDVLIPHGNTVVQGGDHLFVFCKLEHEDSSREMYLDPPATEIET